MTLNRQLLNKARAAGERLAEAERQVQQARGEYHATVRRMHLAGGSLREIARALELSHQRVQQMVGNAGGSWWQRIWHPRNLKRNNLTCTFCGRPQTQLARLIAGPKVFICDACIALAEQSMAGSSPSSAGALAPAGKDTKARCSFCGKRRTTDRSLLTGPSANICGECLIVCRQILIDTEEHRRDAEPAEN